MTRVGFVEWPEGLEPSGAAWDVIQQLVDDNRPDILVTNEMPFGPWIAGSARFDPHLASQSVQIHETALTALTALGIATVISSRPIRHQDRLLNEAFALVDGQVYPLHQKRYFPAEPGWHETAWFDPGSTAFEISAIVGLDVGVLLCTDVMFNEHARDYGRKQADLIVVPRATGDDHSLWQTACSMAAIVSGSYVVSSNRSGNGIGSPAFGGKGMAFSPEGNLIAQTSDTHPLGIIEIDQDRSRAQKSQYPCYVQIPA